MAPYPPYAASGDGCWLTGRRGRPPPGLPQQLQPRSSTATPPGDRGGGHAPARQGASFPMPRRGDRPRGAALRAPAVGGARALTNSGSEAVMIALKAPPPSPNRRRSPVRGRVSRLLRLCRGELASTPGQLGSLGAPASTAYSRGNAAAGPGGRGRAAVQSHGAAVARIEREAKQPGRRAGGSGANRVGSCPRAWSS